MAKRKTAAASEAASAPAAQDTAEIAAKRQALTRRLYALAGNTDAAEEFERVRLELEAPGAVS